MRTRDPEINMIIERLKDAVEYLEKNNINYAITGDMKDFIHGNPVFPLEIEILAEKELDLGHPIKVRKVEFEAEEKDFYGLRLKVEKIKNERQNMC